MSAGERSLIMSIGSLVLLAVIVSVFVIGSKVKKTTRKLQELEESMSMK
jgi:hypothetical protein